MKFHHIRERFIESLLFLSSTVTSFTVLLIIIFLFKEGAGLFGLTPVEKGSVLVLNNDNPVKELNAEQVKTLFDQNVTNWKDIGGENDSVITFRHDDISNYYSDEELGNDLEFVPAMISELVGKTKGIIAYIPEKYVDKNFNGRIVPVEKVTITGFFKNKEWFPTAQPAAQFGVLSLILGTLWVSIGAILIALPLGLATAVYMAEIAGERIRQILKPAIELLAGIPSVVYGFFGLVVIVPQIQQIFGLQVGETALAGSLILGIMALPTIITISEDALRTTPRSMKEASLALGANKWQTIYKVVIPHSISGITAAAVLGIGRAIGETMAVLMVTGNSAVIPHSFLEPVRTIPATIAAELGEAAQDDMHYKALFTLGCILFFITMIINLVAEFMTGTKKTFKH